MSAPVELRLFDAKRGREVPVMLYGGRPRGGERRLAVLSHGYGAQSTDYSFIAEGLVRQGYVVAAVQHELPGDAPMSTSGPIFAVRMPHWRRGAETIGFVVGQLRTRGITGAAAPVLVGHSNGGDTSMLYASEHPRRVRSVISLDNRRFPLPRTREPKVCSVRSADQPADPGVLPTATEAGELGMVIARVSGLKHDDMSDKATEEQKVAMLTTILACLR